MGFMRLKYTKNEEELTVDLEHFTPQENTISGITKDGEKVCLNLCDVNQMLLHFDSYADDEFIDIPFPKGK